MTEAVWICVVLSSLPWISLCLILLGFIVCTATYKQAKSQAEFTKKFYENFRDLIGPNGLNSILYQWLAENVDHMQMLSGSAGVATNTVGQEVHIFIQLLHEIRLQYERGSNRLTSDQQLSQLIADFDYTILRVKGHLANQQASAFKKCFSPVAWIYNGIRVIIVLLLSIFRMRAVNSVFQPEQSPEVKIGSACVGLIHVCASLVQIFVSWPQFIK